MSRDIRADFPIASTQRNTDRDNIPAQVSWRPRGFSDETRRPERSARSETLYCSALSHNAVSWMTSEQRSVKLWIDSSSTACVLRLWSHTFSRLYYSRYTAAAATPNGRFLAKPHSVACTKHSTLFQRQGCTASPSSARRCLVGSTWRYTAAARGRTWSFATKVSDSHSFEMSQFRNEAW